MLIFVGTIFNVRLDQIHTVMLEEGDKKETTKVQKKTEKEKESE